MDRPEWEGKPQHQEFTEVSWNAHLGALIRARHDWLVTDSGTAAYDRCTNLPPLVATAVQAEIAAAVFAGDPRVEVLTGDWRELAGRAPFDLLVLDGGGQGKGAEPPLEPAD